MSNILDDLLGLVDRLTMRHQSVFESTDEDGSFHKVTVMHDSLLEQLRGAVRSSQGPRPDGGGLPSERNVLDGDALELYDTVTKLFADWFKDVSDAKPFKEPEANLRHWYIQFSNRFQKRQVSQERVYAAIRSLSKIVGQIDAKLNPPTVIEITSPCPRCGAVYGLDERGMYRHAVIVESRVHHYRSLENTKARCVHCGAQWVHGQGMRQLRWEIDQKERHAEGESVEQMYEPFATMGSAGGLVRPFSEGAES